MRLVRFFILVVILLNAHVHTFGQVRFSEKENRIDVLYNGKLITSYLIGRDLLKPCLYPVNTLDGQVMTRQFPFKVVEGESTDHPHHTGLYFTFGSKGEVNGNSFWNLHENPPSIQHIELIEKKEEGKRGSLTTVSHWVDKDGQAILKESRTMTFNFDQKDGYTIDFNISLEATDTDVTFKDTKEGMFAMRVADWMCEKSKGSVKGTGKYTNAQGLTTEDNIWGKQSEWVKLEGQRDGKTYGLAILHHPESVNFPTYWHARGYGCFAANPVGQFDFQSKYMDSPQKRDLVIKAGEQADFIFRLLVYESSKNMEELKRVFQKFKAAEL